MASQGPADQHEGLLNLVPRHPPLPSLPPARLSFFREEGLHPTRTPACSVLFSVGHHMGLSDEDEPFSLSAYDGRVFSNQESGCMV